MILIDGVSLNFLINLDPLGYFFVIIMGFGDIFGTLLTMKAIFLAGPGRLAIYRYFAILLAFVFDIFVF